MTMPQPSPGPDEEPSYIDYETFLDSGFSPASFANTLVLATNNAADTTLDLSTPLARVLFDIQEIDSHIELLTRKSALPLLAHTQEQNAASGRIVASLESQIKALNDSYGQLEKEVVQKHAEADEVRCVAERLWDTLRLGRAVGRALQLGRQLEVQHAELRSSAAGSSSSSSPTDHRALVRCAHTLLSLRELLGATATPGAEGYRLDRVEVVRTLRDGTVDPLERRVRETAERIVREFAIAASATFAQSEDAKARTVSALTTLYLLSPTELAKGEKWSPGLMLQALDAYLQSAIQSSVAGLARALAALPGLDRALSEAAARCQNVLALECVLESSRLPQHPLLPPPLSLPLPLPVDARRAEKATAESMLQPLLERLETGSLASYFWRTVAGTLSSRVRDMVAKGGLAARTLRTNKAAVGDAIRDCVVRGTQLPSAVAAGVKGKGKPAADGDTSRGWDREVAVMVGSVVGNLGR